MTLDAFVARENGRYQAYEEKEERKREFKISYF